MVILPSTETLNFLIRTVDCRVLGSYDDETSLLWYAQYERSSCNCLHESLKHKKNCDQNQQNYLLITIDQNNCRILKDQALSDPSHFISHCKFMRC